MSNLFEVVSRVCRDHESDPIDILGFVGVRIGVVGDARLSVYVASNKELKLMIMSIDSLIRTVASSQQVAVKGILEAIALLQENCEDILLVKDLHKGPVQ